MTLAFTKEERFIISLYEYLQSNQATHQSFSFDLIEKQLGYPERFIRNTLKQFIRANFIKSVGHNEATLLPHGEQLVKKLQERLR